jgi:hypothetical protein
MKGKKDATTDDGALYNRRKFLKQALVTMAYVTPVLMSYSSTVFAGHCSETMCGGTDHMMGGSVWSPGCSMLA